MIQEVDARGLACPRPVIQTKQALEKITEGIVVVLVDNEVAVGNVDKLAHSMCCQTEVEQAEQGYKITIHKSGLICSETSEFAATGGLLVMTKATLGSGSDELGRILMQSFWYTVGQSDVWPAAVIFMNSGVQLTVEDSPVLEHLVNLNQKGVEMYSCGTCLDYYHLKDKLAVGQISNMYTILEMINKNAKCVVF